MAISQYAKMLFNAAYQAQCAIDLQLKKLQDEYRISDEEINALKDLNHAALSLNASYFEQINKEALKEQEEKGNK